MFTDRRNAGIALGKLLEVEYKDRHVLVIGIPRGGVEVAYHVAKILNGDLCVLVSEKLPIPDHQELAFGAAAEDGLVYFTSLSRDIDKTNIDKIVADQFQEIQKSVIRYRNGKPLPVMINRVVMLVDEGIATGATLVPALQLCRNRGAAKIVVAVPVAGNNYAPQIASLADEIKIVEQPDTFYAVEQVYQNFPGLTEQQVIGLLEEFQLEEMIRK